jgi:hypothetical protein
LESTLARRICAPFSATSCDIVITGLARAAHRGKFVLLSIYLLNMHPAEDAAIVLSQLSKHLNVRVRILEEPLIVTFAINSTSSIHLDAILEVPGCAPEDAFIDIDNVVLAGESLSLSGESPLFSTRVPIIRGLMAPLVIGSAADGSSQTPAISLAGVIYAPSTGSCTLPRFTPTGERIFPEILLTRYKLINDTAVAVLCEAAGTLILCAADQRRLPIVAVDLATMEVCWSLAPNEATHCYGAAALPSHDIFFASSYMDDKVNAFRISNGAKVCSVRVVDPKFAAADDSTDTLYISTARDVCQLEWICETAELRVVGRLDAAGETASFRPLAIMPPAYGRHNSYLIVGTRDKPTLHVISIPDHRLVHTHVLEGIEVTGLAADPHGNALLVCDRVTKSLHVMSWPLHGMPPVQ